MSTRLIHDCHEKDCPYLTGGKCWSELGFTEKECVRELRAVRKVYDDMELEAGIDTFEHPPKPYVTWRGWKMVRNVITDRIEEITGSRV